MPMTPEESYNAAMAEATAPETEAAQLVADPAATTEPAAEQAEEPAAPKTNPAWDEAWGDGVSEELKQRQAAVFDKWDRNVKAIEARYAPYREYEEKGLAAEHIAQALAIQEALIADPRAFYDNMATSWGFTPQQAAQAAQQVQQIQDDPYESAEDKRIAEMQARIDDFESQWTARQQAEAQAQQRQAQTAYVEQQLSDLHGKVGDFDRNAVVERAILNATTGRNPSIEVAYYEMRAQEDAILARAARQAPRVLGSGAPAPAPAPQQQGPLNDEQRLAKAMALAKQMADGFSQN